MKPEDLLWKVLRATTNSPNDVWKKEHFIRHKGIRKSLLGSRVRRYTVPIKFIAKTNYGNLYLIIQFCTDDLDFPFFVINKEAFSADLGTDKEFVYAFNVRICLESEIKKYNVQNLKSVPEIKNRYRAEILLNAEGLIRDKPRSKMIDALMNTDKYKNISEEELHAMIDAWQFDNDENVFRGISKKEK